MSDLFCEKGTKVVVGPYTSKYDGREGVIIKVGRVLNKKLGIDVPTFNVLLKDGEELLLYATEFKLCQE